MAGFINRWTQAIWIAGVAYEPGAHIPATVDPAQLAYFAAQGIVEPTTAPVPDSSLRGVSFPREPVEEVLDGDDRPV